MPNSLVLDDPAFEVADLADKLSEQTDKRLRAFVKERAERYRDPSRDRAEADWLRARESVTDALAGLLTDQINLRDALKGLHDAGQRVMDAGETGQDERFRKFVNDRTNPLRAAEIAEGVHWNPEELTHVRRPPYDNTGRIYQRRAGTRMPRTRWATPRMGAPMFGLPLSTTRHE